MDPGERPVRPKRARPEAPPARGPSPRSSRSSRPWATASLGAACSLPRRRLVQQLVQVGRLPSGMAAGLSRRAGPGGTVRGSLMWGVPLDASAASEDPGDEAPPHPVPVGAVAGVPGLQAPLLEPRLAPEERASRTAASPGRASSRRPATPRRRPARSLRRWGAAPGDRPRSRPGPRRAEAPGRGTLRGPGPRSRPAPRAPLRPRSAPPHRPPRPLPNRRPTGPRRRLSRPAAGPAPPPTSRPWQ